MKTGPAGFFKRHVKAGGLWFLLANAIPPVTMMVLGPFLIRKIGLEEYAVLNLAIYFNNLVLGYSDFAAYTHLLVSYSRNSPERRLDAAAATILRALLLVLFFCVLAAFAIRLPRHDALYSLLGIFMIAIPITPINFEWYFVARKKYANLFVIRMVALCVLCGLLLVWFSTDIGRSPVFFPIAGLISTGVSGAFAIRFLGYRRLVDWLAAFRTVSFRRLRALFLKLLPMASTLLMAPYFLAFALPWYALTCPDKKLVGAFSISYRLVMGMSSLMAPLVFYLIPRGEQESGNPSFSRNLGLSLVASIGLWCLGIPILWAYFLFSHIGDSLFFHSLWAFSVLMVGFFFLSLRTAYVGKWLVSGRYGRYFLMVFLSCLPVLIISGIGGRKVPPGAVVWLSCLPDALATLMFVGYDRIGKAFKGWFRT